MKDLLPSVENLTCLIGDALIPQTLSHRDQWIIESTLKVITDIIYR